MNQTLLAKKVGVNKATIVRAEDGDPKVSRDTYLKIARVLKTTMAELETEAARLRHNHPEETQRALEASAGNSFRPAAVDSPKRRDDK